MSASVGTWEITADQYHADPCDTPSLSASLAHILCSQSPLHAWTQHPKLNPAFVREEKTTFDLGTGAHALLLEGRDVFHPIDAKDWRTKDAQAERDEARAAGRSPILTHQLAEVEEMVAATNRQLDAHTAIPRPFTEGRPELTLVWEENGVVCRSRLDWLRDDLRCIDDFKTARSADRRACERAIADHGYDVKAAFYLRGVKAVTGSMPAFRWVFVEKTPPYALTVLTPGAGMLALAERKVDHAIDTWRRCLESGTWPSYTDAVMVAEMTPWAEASWLERELEESAA